MYFQLSEIIESNYKMCSVEKSFLANKTIELNTAIIKASAICISKIFTFLDSLELFLLVYIYTFRNFNKFKSMYRTKNILERFYDHLY